MNTLRFEMELLEDAVLPSPPGRRTSGGSEAGLDFVPGAALLGAVARHYDQFGPLAWDVFHAGRVQFGDARIVDAATGAPSLPAPLSYHAPKGMTVRSLRDEGVVDLCQQDALAGEQVEPIRRLFGPSGELVAARDTFAMRTAVAYETGRASEGQLFGQGGLAAGTRLGFEVRIGLDAEPAERARTVILEVLEGKAIFVGRARRSGCGRARVSQAPGPWPSLPMAETSERRISFLLTSETCLFDPDTGMPTFRPRPRHFGLSDGAAWDMTRSFVRVVRWTPYNAKTRRPDQERLALKAGSVISFVVPEGSVSLPALRAALEQGVGAHRSEGLGRVLVQPRLLTSRSDAFVAFEPRAEAPEQAVEVPGDLLGRWLAAQIRRRRAEDEAVTRADDAFETWGRKEAGRRQTPGSSQWQRVRREARRIALCGDASRSALRDVLFGEQGGICRSGVSKRAWFPKGYGQSRGSTGTKLQELVDSIEDPVTGAAAVAHLAKRMARAAAEAKERQA